MTVREFLKLCPINKGIYIVDETGGRKFCFNTTDDNFPSYLENEVIKFEINGYGSEIVIFVEDNND